uniref:HNH endonuclease n=1 Tax=viral metagenome TaxID=1070528 RepID=A0A6C0KFB0_9ZZZZ
MGRPTFTQAQRAAVSAKTGNKCFHCGRELASGWHVDHHPVPFRDIEDNVCCWGVTDPVACDNLKPSCPSCNTSHRYEPPGRWYFCDRTQCVLLRTTRIHLCWAGLWATTAGILLWTARAC